MAAGTHGGIHQFTIFPGILFPACLTLVLAGACWSFAARVSADQDRLDAEAIRLASYARLEAGEIAKDSLAHARNFTDARNAARKSQQENLRLEVRGVMDAVYRLLTAGLGKARRDPSSRREVGSFPPGFDGVRSFLELAPPASQTDEALTALRACSPELASLLPSGCSLAVIEDSSRELLSLGGGLPPDDAVSETITRDFLFENGGSTRHWTVRVELHAPDAHPAPDAAELARVITERLGPRSLDRIAWRGWLLGSRGEPEASFPAFGDGSPAGAGGDLPPYIDSPGEWVDLDGRRLVWLERSPSAAGFAWTPAVAVALDRPAPPLEIGAELLKDRSWNVFLGVMTLMTVAAWVWFVRLWALHGRAAAEISSRGQTPQAQKRLVRDPGLERAVPEVQGVIVADIGDDGRVSLSPELRAAEPVRPRVMPSGSLYRLQGIHRGREGAPGSRILDNAKSPVLRELASRIRPASALGGRSGSRSPAAGGGIASMKSPAGWNRIEE